MSGWHEALDRADLMFVGEGNPHLSRLAEKLPGMEDARAERMRHRMRGYLALHHRPENSAGDRLMRILDVPLDWYQGVERRNLCACRWDLAEARDEAARLVEERGDRLYVLLGRRVATAFLVRWAPFFSRVHRDRATRYRRRVDPIGERLVVLPHPSGLCRAWNDRRSDEAARWALLSSGGARPGELIVDRSTGGSGIVTASLEVDGVVHVTAGGESFVLGRGEVAVVRSVEGS